MTITVYTFRDKDDNEYGSFTTQDYHAAEEYASKYKLKVIANQFEWSDSEQVDDFTGGDEDEGHEIPTDYEVQPLKSNDPAIDRATCGTCGRSWDDGKVTSITPAPSARCPFETFHENDEDEEETDAGNE